MRQLLDFGIYRRSFDISFYFNYRYIKDIQKLNIITVIYRFVVECYAFCSSTGYRVKAFYDSTRTRLKMTTYKDVAHIECSAAADVFVFSYGVAVFWGMSRQEALSFLEELKSFEIQPLGYLETDEFTYVHDFPFKVVDDEMTLPDHEPLTKLAFSYGISQSVKLGTFENKIQKTFNNMQKIPEELANRGTIRLSKKEIRTRMGALFLERASINLHFDILDTPEFFWEYPELEHLYKAISNYLDLHNRVEVLNRRLDIMHELFEMLGNELNHQHSSRLELVIIWLIVIEVVLILMKDVLHIL